MSVGFGIDFGTTNSVAAVYKTDIRRTIPLTDENSLPHPSVVWYKSGGEKTVGRLAKQNITGFANVEGNAFVSSIKRRLGKTDSISLFGLRKTVPDAAADIFRHLKDEAGRRGDPYDIREAVVTIPIYFDGHSRRALRDAANRAGIYIKKFVHEPFAAIVGYCYGQQETTPLQAMEGKIIMVFDWGGGTLDITVVQIQSGIFLELAAAGLPDRAGDHFDERLVKFAQHKLIESIHAEANTINPLPQNLDRLRNECERAKIQLSSKEEELIQVAKFCSYKGLDQNLRQALNRSKFVELIDDDVREAMAQVTKALDEANVHPDEVDHVLLVGGSSRIPFVQQQLRERFGHRLHEVRNADTVIAEGAAIVDALAMQPVFTRTLSVVLSDGSVFPVFESGQIADRDICRKSVNFFCTDHRGGEARLVLAETQGRNNYNTPVTKQWLPIPVSPDLPTPYNHERVVVDFAMDEDMVLRVFGKGATQTKGANCELYDICFGLKTNHL